MASLSAGVFPDAVGVISHILSRNRGVVDAALRDFGVTLRSIFPYYTETIGFDDMPCVMIEEDTVESEWRAIPLIALERYRIRLWGYVHHEEPEARREILVSLARAVQGVLNREMPPVTYGGVQFFWESTLMPSVSFGIGFVGNSVVASFAGECVLEAVVSYGD
jgi:hypothetical protein